MERPAGMAERVSLYNRRRKWQTFLDWVEPDPETSVLDVGITDEEFSPADNFLEKHYPYPNRVTALTHESPRRFRERYRATRVVLYRGDRFPFEDGAFDVCWSNAVLEHVGDTSAQVLFLKEVRRVSRMAFVTTPNRWFPIEVHTRLPLLHYLPKPWFDEILPRLGKGFAAGSYMNLLSLRALKGRLRDAGIRDYRIVKNRLLPFTLDFSVLIGPRRPPAGAMGAAPASS